MLLLCFDALVLFLHAHLLTSNTQGAPQQCHTCVLVCVIPLCVLVCALQANVRINTGAVFFKSSLFSFLFLDSVYKEVRLIHLYTFSKRVF
jgi:hypothetical protein